MNISVKMPGNHYIEEVSDLRERNELLEEQNRQLKELLSPVVIWPREWGLTPKEATLLSLLHSRAPGCVTRDVAFDFLYSESTTDVAIKILDVWMSKIRKKLAEIGVEITTVWGQGWLIDPENCEKLNAVLVARNLVAPSARFDLPAEAVEVMELICANRQISPSQFMQQAVLASIQGYL